MRHFHRNTFYHAHKDFYHTIFDIQYYTRNYTVSRLLSILRNRYVYSEERMGEYIPRTNPVLHMTKRY